jgi:hypothetical protein
MLLYGAKYENKEFVEHVFDLGGHALASLRRINV